MHIYKYSYNAGEESNLFLISFRLDIADYINMKKVSVDFGEHDPDLTFQKMNIEERLSCFVTKGIGLDSGSIKCNDMISIANAMERNTTANPIRFMSTKFYRCKRCDERFQIEFDGKTVKVINDCKKQEEK